MAYLATNIFLADGVTTAWDFSFTGVNPDSESGTVPYLYPEDVKALELYRDAEGAAQAAVRLVTIDPLLPTRANIVGPPIAAGRQVKIYRETEIRFPLVDYRDRQTVSEFDLDLANRQAIFVAQETQDVASNNMVLDKADNYDVVNRRIVNLAPGLDDGDAVNLNQLRHALRVPEGPVNELPSIVQRVGRLLSFDSAGNPIAVLPASGSATDLELRLGLNSGADMVGYDGFAVGKVLDDLIESSQTGYIATHLPYVPGSPLNVPSARHLVDYDGLVYRARVPANFPVTLTGTWATDANLLVEVGDSVLRASIRAASGATLIGTTGFATLQSNLDALMSLVALTPASFGAVGDGVADDTAAVQAAVNYAQDNGGFLSLPHRYRCTATINQTKRLTVQGNGKYVSGIIYTGAGDAWVATPPFGLSNTDYHWRNFGIVPAVAGGGQHGLRIQLQAAGSGTVCFFADSQVWGMYLGDFGAQGLFLDNSVGNVDGFFTCQFMYNTIVNSVLGVNVGDSLNFSHNKIYGKFCGIEMTGVAGARQMNLDDNNITTHGGLIALLSVEEPAIRDCQLEHPGYLSGYTGIYGAGVLIYNCFKPSLVGNTINANNGAAAAPANPGLVATTVAFTGTTTFAHVSQNDIQKGAVDHISFGSTANDAVVDDLNTFYGALPVISDSGQRNSLPTIRGTLVYAATLSVGAATGESFAVAGAKLGMQVEAIYSAGTQGVEIRGWVSAPGMVTVRLENNTGASVPLTGGNILVKVTKF
jgi:hypothetical protein